MRTWTSRRWTAAVLGAVAVAVVTGIPTVMIPNPLFDRMIEASWWTRPAWVVTAVLSGLLLATYLGASTEERERGVRRGGVAGFVGYLAIGCPTCNKLVVLALGSSGAVSWFAPIQPLLAVASIVVLAIALRARLRFAATQACPTGVVAAVSSGTTRGR